jgi:hypothetical protein
MAFREKMERYKAGMEFNLYAAEQCCPNTDNLGAIQKCKSSCPFRTNRCILYTIRKTLGDHIIQHDCMVPPCQCAGDTGEGTVRE